MVSVLPEIVKWKMYGMFSRFIWGGSVDKPKLHLVKWEIVTSLVNQGGLGIMDLEDMNKAWAIKWIYRYANN